MIIATRVLTLRDAAATQAVVIRIYAPEPDEDAWICRYEIGWPEGMRTSFAAGFDAVQALHLALQKIGIDLSASWHHASGHLFWGAPGNGYGFPVPKDARGGLVGLDRTFDG